ncbi:MAG: FHS family L-fucose permease-like MFS transporter [Cryomorphaceae bacterium]|jgi:FHS family L-fucose permease-like MFS transporter
MAQTLLAGTPASSPIDNDTSYFLPLLILTSLFFMWGFLTVLNDILIPYLKNVFDLNYTQALLIQFCFFTAYGVCSIPAGNVVKRVGYQRGMVFGLMVAAVGCFMFILAANMLVYPVFLGALFVLAAGITLLQVSANPYVALLGPTKTAPRRLTLTQAFNSLGTVIGPIVGGTLILSAVASAGGGADAVRVPYAYLGAALLLLAVLFMFIKLPVIHEVQSERGSYTDALQYKHLWMGVAAVFLYVGAEVSIGSLIISFLGESNIAGMAEKEAASYVTYYWTGALIGRFLAVGLMLVVAGNVMLMVNAIGAALMLMVVISTDGQTAWMALIAVGLFNSLMFPTIFSLAIARLGPLASRGSGLLCTAIIGGAFVPLAQGVLADSIGLQISFILPALCYLYIAYYGAKGWEPKGPNL